jgi:hypothetical protein
MNIKNIFLMMAVIITSTIPAAVTGAAEAILPIKARIIRCITQEERRQMCREKDVCCYLPDKTITKKAQTDAPDKEFSFDVLGNEDIEVHEIPYEGLILMAIE